MTLREGQLGLITGIAHLLLFENIGRCVRVERYIEDGDVVDGYVILGGGWLARFVGGEGFLLYSPDGGRTLVAKPSGYTFILDERHLLILEDSKALPPPEKNQTTLKARRSMKRRTGAARGRGGKE